MKIDLSGKTAVVTASTQGIGLASARALAAAGAAVIVNGRHRAGVDRAVAAVQGDGGPAAVRGVAADMGSEQGCEALIAAEPRADILVNNAAFVGWEDLFGMKDDVWSRTWETNVMAGVRLSRHYLCAMQASGWGRVVFISSESARNIQPSLIAYGASKLALHAVSRGIAKRMAGSGVTCNVVMPGPTLSDGVERMLQPMATEAGSTIEEAGVRFVLDNRSSSLIRRMATVDEVAAMVVYVCSVQASATSGSVLRVDGGVVDDVN